MAERELYIVDASVIIKWIIQEGESDLALKLRDDFVKKKIRLGIPAFAMVECMNIFTIKTLEKAMLSLSYLISIEMEEFYMSLDVALRAVQIIKKCKGISFYDALYHALAKQEGGTFITADEKYYRKARSIGAVKLLRNYNW